MVCVIAAGALLTAIVGSGCVGERDGETGTASTPAEAMRIATSEVRSTLVVPPSPMGDEVPTPTPTRPKPTLPRATAVTETATAEVVQATPSPTQPNPDPVRARTESMGPTPGDPPPTTGPDGAKPPDFAPIVTIAGTSFSVDIAADNASRAQGLSGRERLVDGRGMLFLFSTEEVRTFWMNEMQFDLDMVWIDGACKIVDISKDVPAPTPDQAIGDLPTYGPVSPIMYVLEINAGVSDAMGFSPGDTVSFAGSLAEKYGC